MVEVIRRAELSGYQAPGIVVRDHFRLRPGAAGRIAAGLGPVVVLAETAIEVGAGFAMHAHQGVEILSYVCRGRLAHADTMGHGAALEAGDVQVMRCGTGVRHSEVNDGQTPIRMYQMWLAARRPMVEPGYVDLPAPLADAGIGPVTFASGKPGAEGRVAIDVDAAFLGAAIGAGTGFAHRLDAGRALYVVAAEGSVSLGEAVLGEGDAGLVTAPGVLDITARTDARVLVLDVAL